MKRNKLQNYAEYYGLKVLIFIICLLRRHAAHALGTIIALIMYYFIPVRKKETLKNISLSFPEKSEKEVKLIAKNTYKNFVKILIDMVFISKMSDKEIEKLLIFDEDIIKKAFNKGKGLVLLSAHFGNWELSALAFSKKYPVALIIAKQSNSFIDNMISNFRMKEGFNIIGFQRDDKISFRGVMKALKKNHILAILGDQDAGAQGVFLPFFGRLASTPKGPAFFAIHAGSPIITAFGVVQKDGSMKMEIEELEIPNTGNEEKDIEIINTIYNQRLEAVIRKNPEQWFWFHRRWNTRPGKKYKKRFDKQT
ncbi:MAG: lysophospholipid acyltransferase family protein [Endomicrobium sp.]|jgi:KDO2-lipid IV(A) lauroyltransferase|nr:lysophospholipid acyltransferase family protein [Endomicrobium sp.]